MLRSPQGWIEDRIVFSGLMNMLGIECEWRMTWMKKIPDEFGFVNEELDAGGAWEYIDEWQFVRAQQ